MYTNVCYEKKIDYENIFELIKCGWFMYFNEKKTKCVFPFL